MSGLLRIILIILGNLLIGLGLIGMIIPVIPTTPFLLLAAVCFARSSPKFYNWLINNKLFGHHIRNYRQGRGIPLKQKIFAIAALWISAGFSAFYALPYFWIKIMMLTAGIAGTFFILKVKTFRPSEPDVLSENNLRNRLKFEEE